MTTQHRVSVPASLGALLALTFASSGCVGQPEAGDTAATTTTVLITVPSTSTAPLPSPPPAVTKARLPRGECDPTVVNDALFASDVATLAAPTPDMVAVANRLVDLHSLAVDATVSLVGNTDARPSRFPGGNDALSAARAATVADLLVGLGVDRAWIVSVSGDGAAHPLLDGTDEASLAANRRVDVTFHCPS